MLLKGVTADIVDEGQRTAHSYSYHSSHPCQRFFNLPVTSSLSQPNMLMCACVFHNMVFFPAHKYNYTGHQPRMSHPVPLSVRCLS